MANLFGFQTGPSIHQKEADFARRAVKLKPEERNWANWMRIADEVGIEEAATVVQWWAKQDKSDVDRQKALQELNAPPGPPTGTTPLDLPTLNTAQQAGVPELLQQPAPFLGRNAQTGAPLGAEELLNLLPPDVKAKFANQDLRPPDFFPEGTPPKMEYGDYRGPAGMEIPTSIQEAPWLGRGSSDVFGLMPQELASALPPGYETPGGAPVFPQNPQDFFPPGTVPPMENIPLGTPVANPIISEIAKRLAPPDPLDTILPKGIAEKFGVPKADIGKITYRQAAQVYGQIPTVGKEATQLEVVAKAVKVDLNALDSVGANKILTKQKELKDEEPFTLLGLVSKAESVDPQAIKSGKATPEEINKVLARYKKEFGAESLLKILMPDLFQSGSVATPNPNDPLGLGK